MKFKLPFTLIVLTIIGISISAGVFFYIHQKPMKENSAVTPTTPAQTPQSTLTLISVTQPIASASGMMDIVLTTGANRVNQVQIELQFNPAQVYVEDMQTQQTTLFPTPTVLLKDVDNARGRVSFALRNDDPNGRSGTAPLAHLFYHRLSYEGPITIRFLPKSLVSAPGQPQSMLKSTQDIVIMPNVFGSSSAHRVFLPPNTATPSPQ